MLLHEKVAVLHEVEAKLDEELNKGGVLKPMDFLIKLHFPYVTRPVSILPDHMPRLKIALLAYCYICRGGIEAVFIQKKRRNV